MLIGVTGLAGAGKDTIGSYLASNYNFTRRAFADKLKELALTSNIYISGVNMQLQDLVKEQGWEAAKKYHDVRYLLQNLGNGAREVFGHSFWVDQVMNYIDPHDDYVITDVRYKNEFETIAANDGVIIRVVNHKPLLNLHISEVGHLNFETDYIVNNIGSRVELYRKINDIMLNLGYE